MAMNINFDKTDRLIQIIDEAVRVLNSAEYNLGRAFKSLIPQHYSLTLFISA